MAWFPNNPVANQFISQSQTQLQQNFQALDIWTLVDHTGVDSGANNGFHKKTTFPAQAAIPGFPANTPGMYAKVPAAPFPLSAVTELFMHLQSGTEVPFTMKNGPTFTPSIADSFFYLPSNVLVKMGRLVYQAVPGVGQYGPPAAPEVGRYRYTFTVAANTPVFATIPYVIAFPFITPTASQAFTWVLASNATTNFEFRLRLIESAALNQVSPIVATAGATEIYYIAIGTAI